MRLSWMAAIFFFTVVTVSAAGNGINHNSKNQHLGVATTSVGLLDGLEHGKGIAFSNKVKSRLPHWQDLMRPTFASLPKGPKGGLYADVVRYALHRVFVERHAWQVHGLAPEGDSWAAASPASIFGGHSDDLKQLFQAHLDAEEELSLHDVAVLAATLEALVNEEASSRMGSVYRVLGFKDNVALNIQQQLVVIDTYMLLYVGGIVNHTMVTPKGLQRLWTRLAEIYPTWEETRQWAHSMLQDVEVTTSGATIGLRTFAEVMQVVEHISDKYGHWQDAECESLKDSLIRLEEPGKTGRVTVESFYRAALAGQWQFSESIGYLRQLGALDESNPSIPKVVIANYVQSPSNCLAASGFYSVCCLDPCEALLSKLEKEIMAPVATPKLIAQVVANLSSNTVSAPRDIPSLMARLQEIASYHGGSVPLHGKLFSQWLHHAYPTECSFPLTSGTSKPVTARQWVQMTRENPTLDADAMKAHVDSLRSLHGGYHQEVTAAVPWLADEELFFVRRTDPNEQSIQGRWHWLLEQARRIGMVVVTLVSMAVTVVGTWKAGSEPLRQMEPRKHVL